MPPATPLRRRMASFSLPGFGFQLRPFLVGEAFLVGEGHAEDGELVEPDAVVGWDGNSVACLA